MRGCELTPRSLDDELVSPPVRRVGLEQEFFLVDASGEISDLGARFLRGCREAARAKAIDPGCFEAECVHGLVEVTTPPSSDFSHLVENYATNLSLATDAAAELGLGLYPLGTYPLPTRPTVRDEPRCRLKARTLGYERFLHARRCAGVHLHLEAPQGTIWPDVKAAHAAPAALQEMLDLYNLATALDPALVAISRACPFYEGEMGGLAARTIHHRGGFGPDGLYAELQGVGALSPYAARVEDLEARERERYVAWYGAMDLAGVDHTLFSLTGGNAHGASWNPVRLIRRGTVEIRSMDGNYPDVTLAVCAVVCGARERLKHERLRVKPIPGVRTLRTEGDSLLVPDFAYLSETLLDAAVTVGVADPTVRAYLDSLLEFATAYVAEPEHGGLLLDSCYTTTEAAIRRRFPDSITLLPRPEGLRLIRNSCRYLEKQVHALRRGRHEGLRDVSLLRGSERRRDARSMVSGAISAAGTDPAGTRPAGNVPPTHPIVARGSTLVLQARDTEAQKEEEAR